MNGGRYLFGDVLNGHIVGIVLKELVRRALNAVRNVRHSFEVTAKQGKSGEWDDMLTTADRAAQELYVRSLVECFPQYGIIGEEDNLRRKGVEDLYFTVDPVDGTKALVRRQSHGIGTMISLIHPDGIGGPDVLTAYVGDVCTNEIYGYRPQSDKVHRITEFNTCETLQPAIAAPAIGKLYVALRDPERVYSPLAQTTIAKFKNVTVDGGSIGIWLAKLWKGEVGAAIIPPNNVETPWDLSPVVGITRKLGYAFLKPSYDSEHGHRWTPYMPPLSRDNYKREHDLLIAHPANLGELKDLGLVVV